MTTLPYSELRTGYEAAPGPGEPWSGGEADRVSGLATWGLQGSLSALGENVVGADGDGALSVTAGAGISVNVAAGRGIIEDATYGFVAFELQAALTNTVPTGLTASAGALYVYAQVEVTGSNDTRVSGIPVLVCDASGSAAGLRLALINAGASAVTLTTDLRTWTADLPLHATTHKLGGSDVILLNEFGLPTASVNLNSQKITNLLDGVASSDAATVSQLTAITSGATWKAACRIATTAAFDGLSGLTAIDGVTPIAGDRVLVKNNTTGYQNGIYVAAAGAWTRATDFDSNADIIPGSVVPIQEGTVNADTQWQLTTNAPITMDTTALVFSQSGGSVTSVFGQTGTVTVAAMTASGTPADADVVAGNVASADRKISFTSIAAWLLARVQTWTGVQTFETDTDNRTIQNGAVANVFKWSTTAASCGGWRGYHGRGTRSSPAAVNSGDRLASIEGGGFFDTGTSDFSEDAIIKAVATENHTPTAKGSKWTVGVTPVTTATVSDVLDVTSAGMELLADGSISRSFKFPETVAPGTPATGVVELYAKSDGNLYQKDDAGTETVLAGGGGGVSDGDKGDVTVSSSGTVWTVDADLVKSWTGQHTHAKAPLVTAVVAAATISTDQNDYAPTGWGTDSWALKQELGANVNITGLAGGSAGRWVIIFNASSTYTMTLKNSNASSAAANRFSNLYDISIGPTTMCMLWYDSASSKWRSTKGMGVPNLRFSATGKLAGRSTAGAGVGEEITVGSGLTLSAGTLTASGGGGSGDSGETVIGTQVFS